MIPHLEHVKRIHFVGIGGAGMGGIAEVLLSQHYEITGSDLSQNAMVKHLQDLNVKVSIGHCAENIEGANILVVSTAISPENPEIVAARKARIPVIPRAQMLADLMRMKYGIAIGGTHGKTTTTSLVARILEEAGLDPTFVIGGLLKRAGGGESSQNVGTHAHLGQSQIFVAEADESDASFLYLYPQIAIVTNIDADHLETYGGDFNRLKETFIQFLHRLPFNGLAVVCADDPIIREIVPNIARPTLLYGFDKEADLQILDFKPKGFQSQFTLKRRKDSKIFDITLNLPGKHNVLNAAAACVVASELGVSDEVIQKALNQFAGVGRRLQVYGEFKLGGGDVLLVDDYGHHPKEIAVTWEAVRQAWPERRLVVAYQPHRYTRTRDLFNEFVQVLSEQPDQLILLDIYSAGESPISGTTGKILFDAICQRSKFKPTFVPHFDGLDSALHDVLQHGDILLTQGAGNIGSVAPRLATTFL